ncbi:hypothetical protein Tco_0572585 [Tanacetum coccineum]
MDPTSSLKRICLGENVYGSSREKVEGHGDWNAPEYTDTAGSKEKKVTKALSFYKMETDEVSERHIAPCFVNGLEAYDGKINLAFDENLISNEYAVKLCLDYEVKKGNKVVKKELIVSLKGELYFVKFIIHPKEDDVEPEDPFKDDSEKKEKSMDDWDQLLDFNFDDIPQLDGEELSPFDKVKLDGMIVKEEEEEINKVKGEALKEKDNPRAFIFPIRLEGKVGVTTIIAKFMILDIPIDRDAPIVVGRGFLYTIRDIVNTPERLFSTFDRICHQTFRAARSDVLRTAESDSDDEEEYEIKRNKFGAPIYDPKPTSYLNCNNPAERSLALHAVINLFWKITVWKKAVSFHGSLPVPL